ncbi:MAG TPA: hypothetical protein ENI27_10855 [bacterium]|nr:hypothetical protein [bacterium]
MKLTDEVIKNIIDHIHAKWGPKYECPKCYKSSELKFMKEKIRLFELREYHQGGTFVIGGDSANIPVVPIFCKNCGHVDLLNVNIIEEAREEKPATEEPS